MSGSSHGSFVRTLPSSSGRVGAASRRDVNEDMNRGNGKARQARLKGGLEDWKKEEGEGGGGGSCTEAEFVRQLKMVDEPNACGVGNRP